ncbi:MAG: uroporphyrinogen-III C-methyltransferase [Deltaproteobacteria bacterium]|nr:uroporphyrinogen-III C-methyltransferase [Deltaproteobacteria bacterium]MBK8720007.1 uroporphyrinogen-III C-methyltransferase [Deltaproteobacteria bacterium]MBP7288709.1 uroporphyrinogen-III C-methyltransferase [Nannocystaceae bacterium]
MTGFVSLVGAGPGDPGLLTLIGRDRLARADVVVIDYLVNPILLAHCRPDCEIHQREAGPRGGGALDQAETNALLVARARAGARVVRLKGGDPCLFGRGGEEAQVLAQAGIPFEFVPGVTSPLAAPQYAGIPITHRDHTPAVTFVSGWEAYEKAGLAVAWEHLARSAGTLVLLMGVKNARENAQRLIDAGRDPATPAAAIRWGTRGLQRTVVATLATIADRMHDAGLRAPAVMVVGDVVGLREQLSWFESRPLFGRRIVLTRALDAAGPLASTLAELGADVALLPCVAVTPPDDLDALDRAVRSIEFKSGVILSSPGGVTAFFDALVRVGLDLRVLAGRAVVAIGAATERACAARGIRCDLVPERASSEGLVAALREREWLDRAWLHVRADAGRDVLADAIAEAGGHYVLAVGYRVVRPSPPAALVRTLADTEHGGDGFDAIVVASGKTGAHLLTTLTQAWGEPRARNAIAAGKLVAIGPVTAAALTELGLRVDAVAEQPSDDGVVAALRSLW